MNNGLGLDTFLGAEEKPENGDTPSPEETPSVETPQETPEPENKEVPEETPSPEPEVKAEGTETPETPSIDWETEGNPYIAKHTESSEALKKMEKRYHDTQSWANNLNQSNLKMHEEMKVLGQKIDGTYDETVETQAETQNNQFIQDYNARFNASKSMALESLGEQHLNEKLFLPDAPFQKLNADPVNLTRVQLSDRPVHEALRIVEESEFFGKYGKDFNTIIDNIKKEVEPSIREAITKEFEEKIKQKNAQPTTLTNVNSTNEQPKEKGQSKSEPLKVLFGGR